MVEPGNIPTLQPTLQSFKRHLLPSGSSRGLTRVSGLSLPSLPFCYCPVDVPLATECHTLTSHVVRISGAA